MRVESSPEEAGSEFNFENPLLRKVRFCKAIAPKPGSQEAKLSRYTEFYPRIVGLKFKVPSNWVVVRQVKDGETLKTEYGRELIHTCKKPYHVCFEGFWGRWKGANSQDVGISIITR